MAIQTVEEELKSLVQWSEFPSLTQDEIDTLLNNARCADYLGILPHDYAVWTPSTVYVIGDIVAPVTSNGHYYVVSVTGISGLVEPVWPLTGNIVDGAVTFAEGGLTYWTPTYNLNQAAAKGWRLKASKVANRYDQSTDITTLRRSQLFEMCLKMSRRFGTLQSVQIQGSNGSSIYSSPIIGNVNNG